jgi:dissimilatory sulfite reductase (desulfoviridin) alpha/beta subunit
VVVGGCGSRHPQIAQTVTECTDVAGVLKVLEKTLMMFKETPTDGREISFHEVIKKYGVAELKI